MKKEYVNNKCNTLRNTLHSQETVIITVRIPRFVKEYYQKNGISFRKVLVDNYFNYNENLTKKLLEEIKDMENSVLQKRLFVIQLQEKCNTNHQFCNTLFETFKQQGRDINNLTPQDRFWINSQLENNGINDMTITNFIEYCKQKKEG